VADPDLARETAGLLMIADKSPSRSLDELVGLVSRAVPACSAAAAALWEDGEPVVVAASHPHIPGLLEAETASGRGPALEALSAGAAVHCPDTLTERRWPEYAHAALWLGVRCSVTLAHRAETPAVTLSLCAARPRALDPQRLPLAELLVAAGGAAIGNMSSYGEARRTALQLREAATSRAVVDQAKGMLMHALGCSAEQAFERMREISQQHGLRMTDVAEKIIRSRRPEGR
jgi:hypothetical protein